MPQNTAQALAKSGVRRGPKRGIVRAPARRRPAPVKGARVIRNPKAKK